jgi:uncharacterized membrane protein YkoI
MPYEITLEKVEAAMLFLAEHDEPYAISVADLESCDIRRKRVRARVFLESEGTVAERNAEAETHCDTEAADDAYASALLRKETLKAKRQRAELVIDLWRTLEASRRSR